MLTLSTCPAQLHESDPVATNKSAGQYRGMQSRTGGKIATRLHLSKLRKTGIPASDLLGNVAFHNRAQYLRYSGSTSVFRVLVPFH